MPFELRPYPSPTLRPEGEYLQTAWTRSVYPIAERMGIEIRLPSVSPQPYTRLAFEGLEHAKDQGRGSQYNSAVMRAFFQQDRDIGNPDVLTALASDAGLNTVVFRADLEERRYAPRVGQLLRHAYEEEQVSGVPLMVIGMQRLQGVQPRGSIEAAISEAERGAAPRGPRQEF